MSDEIETRIARAAAVRLTPDMPADFEGIVEARLLAPRDTSPPPAFVEPATTLALAGLLVNAAMLGWQIYSDLKEKTPKPKKAVLARKLRLRLENEGYEGTDRSRQVIDVVVEEIYEADSPAKR